MKVWVVTGDNRYYDAGYTWIVGVYATEELGNKAIQVDTERFIEEMGPDTSCLSYDNSWMEVQS